MKNLKSSLLPVLSLASLMWAPASFAVVCGGAAFQAQIPQEASWRQARTQPNQSGGLAATSTAREKLIDQRVKYLENYVLTYKGHYGTGDIPPMEFIPAEGAKVNFISVSDGDNGIITRMKISGIGAAGTIRGTLLLPVSGHNGNANARLWAKTDTYSLTTGINPNPAVSASQTWGGLKQSSLLKDVKSLDMVTAQEIELKLKPNQGTVILYDRKGSAGPGGYVEGRVMEFIWDGT